MMVRIRFVVKVSSYDEIDELANELCPKKEGFISLDDRYCNDYCCAVIDYPFYYIIFRDGYVKITSVTKGLIKTMHYAEIEVPLHKAFELIKKRIEDIEYIKVVE